MRSIRHIPTFIQAVHQENMIRPFRAYDLYINTSIHTLSSFTYYIQFLYLMRGDHINRLETDPPWCMQWRRVATSFGLCAYSLDERSMGRNFRIGVAYFKIVCFTNTYFGILGTCKSRTWRQLNIFRPRLYSAISKGLVVSILLWSISVLYFVRFGTASVEFFRFFSVGFPCVRQSSMGSGLFFYPSARANCIQLSPPPWFQTSCNRLAHHSCRFAWRWKRQRIPYDVILFPGKLVHYLCALHMSRQLNIIGEVRCKYCELVKHFRRSVPVAGPKPAH